MIDEWLKKFNKGWTEKNVDAVMDLFAEDVVLGNAIREV